MTTVPFEPVVDARGVREEALSWPDRARATIIRTSSEYAAACELLKGIKALRQKISDTFDPHVRRAHDAHRALVRERDEAAAPLTEAESILKRSTSDYDTKQERLRREEEQRQREERRRQEEAKRIDEAAALEREAAATGNTALLEEAEQLLDEPVYVPAPVVEKQVPKVQGIVHRESWSARVVNMRQLISYVAAHPECANYLTPNTTALNAAARSLKSGFKVPGVEAVPTKTVAVGSR